MTTVGGLGSSAVGLSRRDTLIGTDAVVEDLLADEGWHGVLVVLKTGGRAVGAAGAVVDESGLEKRTVSKSMVNQCGTRRYVRHHNRCSGDCRCRAYRRCFSDQDTIEL